MGSVRIAACRARIAGACRIVGAPARARQRVPWDAILSAPTVHVAPRWPHRIGGALCHVDAGIIMAHFPGRRDGQAPGAMGLTGKAGLQLGAGSAKKFGLQRSKPKLRPAAGFDEADEEPPSVAEEMRRMHSSKHAQAAAQAAQTAALAEDASVYDYDGVFDSMQAEKQQQRAAAQPVAAQRKTRYIGAIMETHKEREIENDKVFERKLAREAAEEAHLYGDKEKFLTSSYRRKLQVTWCGCVGRAGWARGRRVVRVCVRVGRVTADGRTRCRRGSNTRRSRRRRRRRRRRRTSPSAGASTTSTPTCCARRDRAEIAPRSRQTTQLVFPPRSASCHVYTRCATWQGRQSRA